MNEANAKNTNDNVPVHKKVDDLFALIEKIDICMMTTKLPDGSLVTRPMSTQTHDGDGHLWFMTTVDTHKVEEIEAEPQVSLAYFKDGEWVSVAGKARAVTDRHTIHEMYKPDWKAWLPKEGGAKNGGPDDPRIVLLEVSPETIHYFVRTTPKPLVTFKIAAAVVTGKPPKIGEERTVDARDLDDVALR